METNLELLRHHFALIDASFCFVAKHRASPTVRSVLRVANSFGASQLERHHLVELAALAPELLVLKYPESKIQLQSEDVFAPAPVSEEDVEIVTFPLAPQTSQRASIKRKALFNAALKTKKNLVEGQEQTKELLPSEQFSLDPVSSTSPKQVLEHNDWGSSVLAMLQQLDLYKDQIVHVERRSSRQAQYRDLKPLQLSTRVCQALEKCHKIQQLYSHQFEAIDAICHGNNVVLSTATASGKSLAYNTPMLSMLLEDPNATFIYLFPTKALAQDQLKALIRLLDAADLSLKVAATFDGDTPMKSRSKLIRETRIFLTNPDMLHLTILPQHRQWSKVLSNLRLLVVDEAHMYRGVFGSHVSCVFRRLFRLCALYGSNPQIVCCSATIQNPEAHFCQLLPTLPQQSGSCASAQGDGEKEDDTSPPSMSFFRQRHLKVITEDGAPSNEKVFCIWNPKGSQPKSCADLQSGSISSEAIDAPKPTISSQVFRKRKRDTKSISLLKTDIKEQENDVSRSTSAIYHGSRLLARFVEAEIATLLFCRGRKLTELVLMNVHSILNAESKTRHLHRRVSSYRGGYTLECRRRIEQRLFNGDLLGVVATNALELGIDIGELDCTIHLGLPSSIASLWQQAGRAGRRQQQTKQKQSVAVIVCFDAPLDQHFAQKRHAMELFKLSPEAVSLNPMNHRVLGQHLLCAARESALYSSQSGTDYIDSFVFGNLSNTSEVDNLVVTSEISQVLDPLVQEKKLMKCLEAGGHWNYRVHPCMPIKFRAVNLRSICDEIYTVMLRNTKTIDDVADEEALDEIPGDKAFFQVYPTAVYLHQAQEYLITRLDCVQRIAYAEKCPESLKYFTTCRDCTDLEVVRVHSTKQLGSDRVNVEMIDYVRVCVGTVSIKTRVFGSTMLEKRSMRLLGTHEFSLPPMQSFGEAVWLEFPIAIRNQVEKISKRSWTAALHGVGHLFVALVRLFILCDAEDVGTEHVNEFEQRIKPNRVTIFERREGGSGLIPEITKILPKLIEKAWTIASECLMEVFRFSTTFAMWSIVVTRKFS
ncbi:Predicted ATP-dependent RNA helicase [Plasmopara halstedii]|uniref:Predicted ATP-dependent RNA helicase n=1 Tax=Plasmopara halstedii TaxID=4781 RepID=A0A0P1ARQ6_PLAHL|nr:Predicted ATP-dependent RNA helicase [Plasmopara halstedii]CEG43608.1 Predicted ATP-dependent RNA helicase [Plasmopara halstedii]|eukprot:XP_024579977.1 Predicted ATP-dependent RNA helicase [Plasmopara halstedii]